MCVMSHRMPQTPPHAFLLIACTLLGVVVAAQSSWHAPLSVRQGSIKVDQAKILSTFKLVGTTPAIKSGQCSKSLELKRTSSFKGSNIEKTLEGVLGGPSTVTTAVGSLVVVVKHRDIELDVACKADGEVVIASPAAVKSLIDLTGNVRDLGNLSSLADSAKGFLSLIEGSGVAIGYDQSPRKCGSVTLPSGYLWLEDLGGEAGNVSKAAGVKNPKKGDLYLITSPTIPEDPDTVVAGTAPLCVYEDETRPTTKATSSSSPKSEDNGGNSCFPAHSSVEVKGRGLVRMDQVQLGDRVRVGPAQFSEVFMWTHKLSHVSAHFLNFVTECDNVLAISPGHYLPAGEDLVPAQSLRVGDKVTLESGHQCKIVQVYPSVHRGLFNPQTIDGRIIVNGVLTSTYTTAVQPVYAHAALAPLRALYRLFGITTSFLDSGWNHFPLADFAM